MLTARRALALLLFAGLLSGCLPRSDMKLAVVVLDEATGKPVPDAWVLVTAHVITEPRVDRYEVVAANRGRTNSGGVVRLSGVEGLYRPDAPKNWLWRLVDEKDAKARRMIDIEGGSIVVIAAGYGFIHQPFAVEDSAAFQAWLKADHGRGEDYGGWLGRRLVKVNLPAVFVKSEDFRGGKGMTVTLRLKKPADVRDLAGSFDYSTLVSGTWSGMSVHTGATERQQRLIYGFFAKQMKAIADETQDPRYRELFEEYFVDEAIRWYIAHRLGPGGQDGSIQVWLCQKALELLPAGAEEAKVYGWRVLKGVVDEGRHPRWRNHHYDAKGGGAGLPGFESAPRWAAVNDTDNPNNEWDWVDAQRYYREGDKARAYEALGHVLRLLANMAVPKYTRMSRDRDSEFEEDILRLLEANAGNLPPEYYLAARSPRAARTPGQRFDDLARRTIEATDGLQAKWTGGMAVNGRIETKWQAAASAVFPLAIEQAAGLLHDFHRLMHPPLAAQAPRKGGDGGNGAEQAPDESTGTAGATHPNPEREETPSSTVTLSTATGRPARTRHIELEEVRFAVMDGDRIVEERNMQSAESYHYARQRHATGLPSNQRIVVERLERPRLKFIDEHSRIIKEMLLGGENSEALLTFRVHGSTRTVKTRTFLNRTAEVSADMSHAVVWEMSGPPSLDPGRDGASSLSCYDRDGTRVWRATIPWGWDVMEQQIFKDGSQVVTLQTWNGLAAIPPPDNEPRAQVVLYDNSGNVLFRFPAEQRPEHSVVLYPPLELSPSWRYLGVHAFRQRGLLGSESFTLFLDIVGRRSWSYEGSYEVWGITDQGMARVKPRLRRVMPEFVDIINHLVPIE